MYSAFKEIQQILQLLGLYTIVYRACIVKYTLVYGTAEQVFYIQYCTLAYSQIFRFRKLNYMENVYNIYLSKLGPYLV